jgi:hypothetical protein
MSNMFLNIVSTFKDGGIKQANGAITTFKTGLRPFSSLLGTATAALASFGIAAKGIQFGKEAITQARDLERNLFALQTVFDGLTPGMLEFSKNAENIGLSQSKAAKASVFIGSVLKQSGFEMSAVAKETQNLVTLGTDLAALYGYDVQEALLGMTALFRGEYDPIEKFGVAMKQSEINAELAARGQDKLEGAARRNAEQTIRLELLYQRAEDAMGAFTAQTGSLYTEQKKLGATFENMQATLGIALLPAVTDLNEQLRLMLVEATPGLISMFEFLGQVLEGIVGIFRDAMNPTTDLGESVAALGIQFESLGRTLFGDDFNIAKFFEVAGAALGMFLDLMHDLMNLVENLVIGFQVMGHQIGLLFSLKFEELLNFDAKKAIRNLIDLKDGAKDFRLQTVIAGQAVKDLGIQVTNANKGKLDDLQNAIYKTGITAKEAAIQMGVLNRAAGIPDIGGGTPPPAEDTETETTGGSTRKSPTGLPALIAEAKKDAKVAKKETKLIGSGLSSAVAEWITSSSTPIKAANQAQAKIAKNGQKAIANLTKNYNKSSAGQQAAAQAAAEASRAAAEAAADFQRAQEETARAEAEALAERARIYNSFLDSIKSTFAGIKNSIMGAFDIKELGGSTNSIIRNMNKLLSKVKDFSKNISQLATMGLDPALLQQVIQAGPMAGARLASALVAGGAGALGEINAGFGQIGSLATEIATTGTQSLFGQTKQETVYNINVSGGVGSGATIGKAIVDAIKDYERTSGAVWQGA